MLRKIALGGIVIIGFFIAGFMFLLRSCLSRYDERSVISTPLLFEENGKTVVFSLVKFEKTTSYQQDGGFIRKSVNTSYTLQINDAGTADKLLEQPLKKHQEIKSYPVEVIGASKNLAWVFAGELMAFNPFTLEKMVDTKVLEEKNPLLAGKLIAERKYYEFDSNTGAIHVTLNDGAKYLVNGNTIIATPVLEDELTKEPGEARKEELETALKKIQKENEIVFARFRNNSKAFSQKLISANAYRDSSASFSDQRRKLDKVSDSLRALQRDIAEEIRNTNSRKNIQESLQRGNNSFGSIKSNCDTFNTKWYGLYTTEELSKLWERFDYRSSYSDADRNYIYSAAINPKDPEKKYSEWIIATEKQKLNDIYYLQGGFLMDKLTGMPFHLHNPDAFLIAHKDKVGTDGIVLLSKTDLNGKQLWTINTGLKELSDWSVKGNQMIITGRNNKALSAGEVNILHSIELKSGRFSTFDFFNQELKNFSQ